MTARRVERRMRYAARSLLSGVVVLASSLPAIGDGTVSGHARFEKIKGVPLMGYQENPGLCEAYLFLSPCGASPVVGPYAYLGKQDGVPYTWDGYYVLTVPGGTYSILVNMPTFFIRPRVLTDVVVPDSQSVTQHVDLAIDYSTYINEEWTLPADSVWYQTFTATGAAITGASVRLAGSNATAGVVQILEDNGDPDVRNWTLVGGRAANTFKSGSGGNDNWTRWRSPWPGAPAGDTIPTVRGRKYAMKVTGIQGGDHQFAPFKRNKDSLSYVGGRAYNSAGVAQNFDLNYAVFSDNDGTRITMNNRASEFGVQPPGSLWGPRWGQTFVAHGSCLAGVDVMAATGEVWLDFTWTIRQNGPGGAVVAPVKTTASGRRTALHGVSYCYGEAPLTPGQTYYVEITVPDPSGFWPYYMGQDSFADGMAYYGDAPQAAADLAMTIIEYTNSPYIVQSPTTFTHTIQQGRPISPDTLTVRNRGGGTLNYAISGCPWAAASPSGGSLTAGQTATHSIQYNTASLKPGSYTCTLTISDPNAENDSQTINVDLEVTAFPVDFDGDGDVDLTDFAVFQICFGGPNRPPGTSCHSDADFDDDSDVDLTDFATFQACFNGPNRSPACP